MITFDLVQRESQAIGERNDCTVKAVSIACQIPYSEAHGYLKALGRRKGCGWFPNNHQRRKRGHVSGYIDNLDFLGIEYERVSVVSKTVSQIEKELRTGHYMVHVRGHVLALVDGKVQDWTEGRRHRIVSVYKIKNPRVHKVEDVVISPTAPKGFRKLRHKKAKRLGLDPKTGLPLA
jgi:hypothetical protein